MRPQIVLFGDSITEQSFRSGGWGASLTDTYSRKDSVKPPVAATIFFGANDAALIGRTHEKQHVPVEEYGENLRKIVQHLKGCSSTMLIVLITPPPVYEEGRIQYANSMYGEKAMEFPERTNEAAGIYARQCGEIAKELGTHFIDLWSKMQETEGWQKKFLSDGLHLTPEGNAVVHQEVVRVFSEAGLSAEEMPSDFPHHLEIDGEDPERALGQQCL